ncbi:MAG: class I SAM-dependent methyltransferase [Candidatus Delongbacteria bacterium]|nr:class I SAM-dependent methyltransferase [Candidatus Delongbacteria bacterium]
MNQGIIKISEYNKALESSIFIELEKYSDEFIKLQEKLFPEFSKKWVGDSFHQWSRQYEYPFVADAIQTYVSDGFRILDAGSGITFFPYYLKEKFPGAEIECCDYDPALEVQYSRVNSEKGSEVKYFSSDIKEIDRADGYYSVVYCISVLEHTDDYEAVVKELARITSPGGHLILTFDISTDGSADIPLHKAAELLNIISKYYDQTPETIMISKNDLEREDILSTNYIKNFNKELLPWRYPYLMGIKSILKGKIPKHLIRDLTCYCGIFKKK